MEAGGQNGSEQWKNDQSFWQIIQGLNMEEPGMQGEITAPGSSDLAELPDAPSAQQYDRPHDPPVTDAYADAVHQLGSLVNNWQPRNPELGYIGMTDSIGLFEDRQLIEGRTAHGRPMLLSYRSVRLTGHHERGVADITASPLHTDVRFTDKQTGDVTNQRYYFIPAGPPRDAGGTNNTYVCKADIPAGDEGDRPEGAATRRAEESQAWQRHVCEQTATRRGDPGTETVVLDPVVDLDELHFLHDILQQARPVARAYDDVLGCFMDAAEETWLDKTDLGLNISESDMRGAARLYHRVMGVYYTDRLTPEHIVNGLQSVTEALPGESARQGGQAEITVSPSSGDNGIAVTRATTARRTAQPLATTLQRAYNASGADFLQALRQRRIDAYKVAVDAGTIIDTVELMPGADQVDGAMRFTVVDEAGRPVHTGRQPFTLTSSGMAQLRNYLLAP